MHSTELQRFRMIRTTFMVVNLAAVLAAIVIIVAIFA